MQETITLYLGLEPGKRADLEVVGLSAAAFSDAVREIAFILDPSLEIRIEFDSGTEGSLKLKAILRSLRSADAARNTLITVVCTVALTLAADLRTYSVGKLIDRLLLPEQRQELSDHDVDRIAKAVTNIQSGRIAKEPIQEMYKQLDRDPVIESVGAVTKPDEKPDAPIPRSEFPIRAGIVQAVETTPNSRVTPTTERLTLISPVLLLANRVWRFRSPLGEFSYLMADDKFLSDIFLGKRKLPMKENIQITAKVDTIEEFAGGVWTPKHRIINKVVRIHKNAKQSDLFSQPKKRKASSKKKR